VFEKSRFWVTARSELSLRTSHDTTGEPLWTLDVEASVAGGSERLEERYLAGSAAVLNRTRLSAGRNRRFKSWDYQGNEVYRQRRDPGRDEAALPPKQWGRLQKHTQTLPLPAGAPPLTSPYGLLLRASDRVLAAPGDRLELLVHTDHNLYRVSLSVKGREKVPVDLVLLDDDGRQELREKRPAWRIAVASEPVGELIDKPDFELLGLDGELTLYIDQQNRLPLLVAGHAPRLGRMQLPLREARLAGPAP
jgi:hypothetical protein